MHGDELDPGSSRAHALYHCPHESMLSHSHQNHGRKDYEEPQNIINDEDDANEEDILNEDAIMQDMISTYFDPSSSNNEVAEEDDTEGYGLTPECDIGSKEEILRFEAITMLYEGASKLCLASIL